MSFVVEAGIGTLPGDVHRAPRVLGDQNIPAEAARLLEHELVRKPEIGCEVRPHARVLRLVERNDDSGRSLRRRQVVAVDFEFVLLRLAAEDRMLIEHQYAGIGMSLAVGPARGKSRHSAADDDRVRALAGIRGGAQAALPLVVAYPAVGGVDDFVGIAVRARVVADAPGAGPLRTETRHRGGNRLRLGLLQRRRRRHAEQCRSGADQRPADEIAPRDAVARRRRIADPSLRSFVVHVTPKRGDPSTYLVARLFLQVT